MALVAAEFNTANLPIDRLWPQFSASLSGHYLKRADAAISLCMEEAARVVENHRKAQGPEVGYLVSGQVTEALCRYFENAIRSLGKPA